MIEHATGKPVLFIAYPFGDYDHYLVDSVGRAGYDAALTCEAGKVRRGSDPLRMRRMVVEKKMDFVSFRHYLGAGSMPLDEMTPQPGVIFDPGQTLIGLREDPESRAHRSEVGRHGAAVACPARCPSPTTRAPARSPSPP